MSGPGGGSGFKGSSTETPSQTVGDGGFYIKDQGSADANKAGYGQLWIKTGSPNDLYFVNEDGQQVRITNGSSIAAAAGASVEAHDINPGNNNVSISTTSGNITLVNSLTASDGLLIPDDTLLRFGSATAGDATIEYDENDTDNLCFAGANVKFTQDVTFNENVTLGNAATDIVTVSGHLTASNSVEIRGSKEERNLVVTGSSLMMGTGSAYTLVVSGGLGLLVESTNEPGDPNELDDRAVLTLKDAGDDGDTDTTFRAYIQAIDHTDDAVWRIGDARNGDKNLELLTQVSVADIALKTKSSDGGAITLSPRENVAFDIRPEGDSTFSGSLTVKGDLTASNGINIPDNQFLRFGDDSDITAEYDEDGFQQLSLVGAKSTAQSLLVKNTFNGTSANARIHVQAQGGAGIAVVAYDSVNDNAEYSDKGVLFTDTGCSALAIMGRQHNVEIYRTAGSNPAAADKKMVIDANSKISLSNNDNGTSNTILGKSAASSLSSGGNYNLIIGEQAGTTLTTGDTNTLMGFQAGTALTTGSNNVAIGPYSLFAEEGGSGSVAIGPYALYSQKMSGSGIANNRNIAIGENAGYNVTTGSSNVAVGPNALFSASVLHGCTAIGNAALYSLHGPENNDVNIGWDFDDFGGTRPSAGATAVGEEAGYFADGIDNTFIGHRAGKGDSLGAGNYNTFVGAKAGSRITSATNNILIGAYAAANFYNTASALTTGANNIVIGNQSEVQKANSNSSIVLGHGIQSTGDNDFDFGKVGNVVTNDFDTDAAWSRVSDVRKKRNIQDDRLGLEFINKLRTVTHQWIPSNELPEDFPDYNEENNMNLDITIHGMIAQEVKQALDEVGCDTFGGWKERTNGIQTLSREMFVIPLIKSVQELSAKVAELEDKLEDR